MDPTSTRRIGQTDLHVTCMGFGGAPLGNLFAEITEEDAQGAIRAAWEGGVRYFDTAPLYGYGLSEARFNIGLRPHVYQRDTWALSSKVGRVTRAHAEPPRDDDKFVRAAPFETIYDYSYDGAMRAFEQSLLRLGTHRIDLLYIHDIDRFTHGDAQPAMFKAAMDGAARALHDLKDQGVVKAIGVGVNESDVALAAIRAADLDCALLAGRYTLLEQGALDELLPECQRRGCAIVLGGPYNSGILVRGADAVDATYDYGPASEAIRLRVRAIEEVCAAHHVRMPAVALQFVLAHPAVASVIPGGRTAAEVTQNLNWLRDDLPAALWDDLRTARGIRADAPVPSA